VNHRADACTTHRNRGAAKDRSTRVSRQARQATLAALFALFALSLALPTAASAQATRTWVSGVGDDANPCSRTAPCKTFAGAISKTAENGEISVLDSSGFGAVTITKSITIDGHGSMAGVLTNASSGIIVNADPTDKVILRDLRVNGLGTASTGIRVLKAGTVRIQDSRIFGFVDGVLVAPTTLRRPGCTSGTRRSIATRATACASRRRPKARRWRPSPASTSRTTPTG